MKNMARGILLFGIICFSLRVIQGCQLQGVTPGITRVMVNIWDYQRGDVYENQIISITGVIDIVQNGVNYGPYISARIEGSTFYLATTTNYETYEDVETLDTFTLTAQFRCLDGTAITQVFQVDVRDTNNNSPIFLQTNDDGEYDIAIATPLLPGHQITGCQHNIVVRDIDLTTSRIDFALTGSDLFEIEYDEASSTTAKEFVAVLKTKTFIRTLPDPVELVISATDVDATGNDPRTSYATVRITADSEAEFPEEPVFDQALYTARYAEDDTIVLDESISLQQGYHDHVEFSLNEEYGSYFDTIRDGNNVSLIVTIPLTADILTRQQIYLIIRADREFTSGATATIVVYLPEEIFLQFEQTIYEGVIEDNILEQPNIRLTQGYEDHAVSVSVSHDYFSAEIHGNEITLSMSPLTQEIIDGNAYLTLEVIASTDRSVATTVVTLEIVKDDTTTPLFQNPIYIGSYNADAVLTLEQIVLIQGFDNTVQIDLDGEYSDLFELIRNGAISTLSVRDTLPLEELGEQTIILTIHATKLRTVGAAASIYISLPEEIKLEFEHKSYEGTITGDIMEIPNVILTQGYENHAVSVNVSNDFFTAYIHDNNVITLTMEQLTDDVIQENSFLNLVVMATTPRSSAFTIVTLEIIKNDTNTPIFENALYTGTYDVNDELTIEQINVIQGYDETVEVTLDGDHMNLFQLIRNGSTSILTVDTIPPAIFNERKISLTVSATKPRTVGATAVINIALPADRLLKFEDLSYKGTYKNDILSVKTLTLSDGYDTTVNFDIDGDYNQYFRVSNTLNQVFIELYEPFPNSVVLENNFLQLAVIATGINALPATASLVIEIIKDDLSTPLFSQNIYSIAYSDGDIESNNINMTQGFDSTVTFQLDGDDSQYFSFSEVDNGITLSLQMAVPEEVIFNRKTLKFSVLAEKPLTVGSHATVVITFPSELIEIAVMRFSQNTYIGSLDDGILNLDQIILDTGYKQDTEFILSGEYYPYFNISNSNEIVTITTSDTMLPEEVLEKNKFIVLEVEARRDRAASVFSSVVIELIQEEAAVKTPVFNAAYYRGSYDLEEGLKFTDQISLVQGYDNTVSFDLRGEFSDHFSVSDDNNIITLTANEVPESVWEINDQLILTLIASKPEVMNGSSAIVIDMPKDHNLNILEFERSSYIGSIENDIVTIQPIILTEGYTNDVVFSLFGDLETYFTYTRDGASITLRLVNTLPEESIPANGIIVLGVQASTTTDSLPAVTTVIFEVIRSSSTPDVEILEFGQTYYVGTYNAAIGVTLDIPISLNEGYINGVQFTLDGDSSAYFSIAQDGNSVTLTMREAIPPAVIANNNQLIFVINAQTPGGATAQATVVILLPNEVDENTPILGFERSSYIGSIENDIVTIQPIILTEGYTNDVVFSLFGDLETHFTYTRDGASIALRLVNTLPEESIPANGIIVLGVQASTTTDSLPAVTTVILEVIRSSPTPDVEILEFGQTYYVGTYNAAIGVTLDIPISLTEGYIDGVHFTLDGDSSSYFSIAQDGNSVTLTMREAIPPAVIANNNQLIFVINAQTPGGATAQATVVILLPNEVDENTPILGFERSSYIGSIENDIVIIQPIILTEGYTNDVVFSLFGDLETHFTYTRDGASIALRLVNTLPEESIPANGIIVLGVQASTTTDSLPAVTTVILEIIRSSPTPDVEILEFGQTYYVGTYNAAIGVTLDIPISLTEGYIDGVQFTLDGDSSAYFAIAQDGNSVTLTMREAIPPAVIANNNQLIFVINAQTPGGSTAQATVVILLPNEVDENTPILGFERSSYIGSIENDIVTIQPIILTEGYTNDVVFSLFGDLETHFTYTRDGASIALRLVNTLPEESIPANGIIVLGVQASTTTDSLPAVTTVILEVIRSSPTPDVEILEFGQTYYVGTYNAAIGVTLDIPISLTEGYIDGVHFTLDGDSSSYFSIAQDGNSVTLTMREAIPPAVIANNNQLIFVINAQTPGGATAQATVVILLPNEVDENTPVLGFERSSYIGSIENDIVTIQPIILTEGYTNDVVFSLFGDLETHFTYTRDGASIALRLVNTLPEESIPANGIIVLGVQASTTTNSLPAVTTVILEVIRSSPTPDVEILEFGQTYYVGTYNAAIGVTLDIPISLTEGYIEGAQFTLDGDSSAYFSIAQDGNSVTLTMREAIPPAVIANNNQLIFVINAQTPGGATAQATVVILLPNEVDENTPILGFERSSYIGSIENDIVTIQPIILTEGYTNDVVFSLFGDLETHFTYTRDGASIALRLVNTLPGESIPANGIIVLGVQASTTTDSLPAVTTVILEVIRSSPTPDVEILEFGQTYYVGTYNAAIGVTLDIPISLTEGYIDGVHFTLDGDSSSYFSIAQDGNSVTLTMREAIPPAVIANNNQLIFVINAQTPGGATAQATVVILLPNEVDENTPVLGFERSSYIGSIENDIVTIQPIILTEGYTNNVVFSLFGDLETHFTYTRDGASIALRLVNTLPEESIPANGIIVLGVQASTTTDSLPAVTTVILEVIRSSPTPDVEILEFGQTYYVGTYNAAIGVTLDIPISLTEGYIDGVQFTLDGDSSAYFSIAQDGNYVTLTMREAIPPAVIANNNQLIFVINAQTPGGATAQATVVILLPNEVDENTPILGFERSSYIGSIENDIVTIQPIILTEGYTNDVVFSLFGDLETHFTYTRDGASIALRLVNTLSEESIPANGIIVLGVQASTTTDSLPAVTTVILEVIRSSPTPDVEILEFGQTYYVGTYNAAIGVTLDIPISLTEGYIDGVQFTLDGDSSAYFSIAQDGNYVTLTMREAIPPAVIANNNQLIFVINAQTPGGATAQATVVILLPNEVDENTPILGFERSSYIGSIENDIVTIQPIILTEGYTNDVVFSLFGDLETHFTYTRDGASIALRLVNTLSEESIPANGIIVLGVQASTTTDSLPAVTTVILEVIRSSPTPDVEILEFGQTYYVGTYNAAIGVTLDIPISLTEGYIDGVHFTLDGDSSSYFSIAQDGNSVTLTMREAIPPAVIANNNQLIFVINAQTPGGATAQATVVILLPNEVDENTPVLGFERSSYIGSIENDIVTIQPIILTEGYTNDVVFSLFGDLETHFTYTRDGASIALRLVNTLPEESIPANGIIVLGVQASTTTDSLPAVTTVILEVIRSSPTPDVEMLEFGQTYYVGTYNAAIGVTLDIPISLTEGYIDGVQFTLDGDSSAYFSIAQDGNSVTLTMREAIPPAVIANNNQLIFVINAQTPGGATAQATVVILLPNEVDENTPILGFERSSYIGSIENDIVTIQPIILTEGYTNDVVFSLFGDLETHFTYTRDGASIALRLVNTLPEESIPANGIIVLGVQASTTTDSLPAVTTVILEVIRSSPTPDVEILEFGQTYYVGTYNAAIGVTLDIPISLTEGYIDGVHFTLDGDSSSYFSIAQDGNSVTLTMREAIPPAVIANNNQLIFVINAQTPGGATAQATVVILLPNEVDENTPVLGFERSSYIGSIENDIVTIQPIILTEGYTNDVVFSLFGDLETHFTYTRDGASIALRLVNTLPEESIPANGIIVLGVQASTTTDSLPAVTTVILEVIRSSPTPDVEILEFGQTYYVGTYNAAIGVTLDIPISLTEGYIDGVHFTLDGDSSAYFSIAQDGNSVTLTMREAIPPAVIANNNQLIFVINAQTPGGATAQATVVILLPNEVDENTPILGFERSSYIGSIENDIVTIQPIILTEGYTNDVVFSLFGDLETHFTYTRDGASIALRLVNTLPEESIPANGIIVLGVQASTTTDSLPAVTTVILEVIRSSPTPDVEILEFGQTYYVGTYNAAIGVTLDIPISLTEGYIDGVQFTLDGDSSAYFSIAQDGNSVTLTMREAIPPAVIANNNQLIFVINAQTPGGATAQATVVILLPNEVDENTPILGFERSSYIGSIENDIVTIQPIILTEGYTNDVVFSLFGDLETHFTYTRDGASIALRLVNTLPEESIPANGIIVLGVQASTTTDSLPAVTTVILEVIRSSPTPDVEILEFGQTYYVGTYNAAIGVTLDIPISLTEGYIDGVHFTLDGDSSSYFSIAQDGNSVTLTMREAIPPAVIANNNQLIFVINAQTPGGATAQATVVILLPNEVDENTPILGFERSSYIGSIENDIVTIQPIILTEGYTNDVVFSLFGDLETHFTYTRDGASIALRLVNTLPEESIPANGIIVLGVQASTTTDSLPAVTTVILEVIRSSPTPDVEILEFGQTYYVGTYNAAIGVTLDIPISLTEGYIDGVHFTLDGDSSAYFLIAQDGNSVTLTMREAIPPAVIANNNQLIFVINAQTPGGATAQATVVILLPNEVDENTPILGFERSSYIGSIENDIVTIQPIILTEGYTNDVVFSLFGDLETYFTYTRDGPSIALRLDNTLPEESIPANGIIVLGVQASTTINSLPTVTTVILEVIRSSPTPDVEILEFGQTYYVGTYNAAIGVTLDIPISLTEGYIDGIQFTLDGDSSAYFLIAQDGNSVTLTMREAIPPAVIANNNQLIFVINAQTPGGATAQATVVILLPNELDENTPILGFERSSYVGSIENDIVTIQPIILTEGYTDDVVFLLFGEMAFYFVLHPLGNTLTVDLLNTIPSDELPTNIILGLQASSTNVLPAITTIILEVTSSGGSTVTFSKALYEGLIQADLVQHESITVTGYDGRIAEIKGAYAELFTASLSEGVVTVERTGTITLPTDVTHVAVEIHVGVAAAVLLLQVFHTDTPNPPPTVTFSSPSYVIRAEALHTGVVGTVSATADNGESLGYSVVVDNAHLAARLTVNNVGELLISSPVDAGEYTFQVVAMTLITQTAGAAMVYLSVDVTGIILPPLIVLDRDEEEAHANLVVFNGTDYAGCSYALINRFPDNQDWLYVDETGLHARVIDREDPSIAFMALSQVQVELEVHCNSLTRNKRAVGESRLDWLGPYDYGTSTWILGESIDNDPTRSVVNLIVNDINDNSPIFVGIENEPVAVGYPVPELEDIVLPRALVQLQATDADVGENALLVYWSAEPSLAVSPTSGSVHVRDDVTLYDDQELVVHATDRNGQGNSAAIRLVIKLLDSSKIAVVTVRNAFLEDEARIIANLSTSVGHEVKVLRAVVISDATEGIDDVILRQKRQTSDSGASLQLFVYGLIEKEPVAANVLVENINSNATGVVSIADTISLEDHLEARQIHSRRDVGLLVATIVLSVLLFILIVAILTWFFVKWRKERKYEEFNDESSLESRNESVVEPPKIDVRPKPRINLDDLKRSERRLQEMIDAPYNEAAIPTTSTPKNEPPIESIVDISQTDPNILVPIVIKDKLKDADDDLSDTDEFGEVPLPRRKSVVTFNENVEKIIHVDNSVEGSSTTSDVEIFRF